MKQVLLAAAIALLSFLLTTAFPIPVEAQQSCSPAYPDVCIAPPPPDLDCGQITHRNFRVLPPDPHRFDGDRDGISCEN